MLTRESRKWPVQKARGAILLTPRKMPIKGPETRPGSGQPKAKIRRFPWNPAVGTSFLYLITIFLKHAFERVGKSEPQGFDRALPIFVERLVADFESPVRLPVVMGEHQVPSLFPLAEQDLLAH